MPPLRIALTLSGAVSLGAYEAGAMAALLRTLQAHVAEDEPPVIVDAISGASAGSMTGLLTAFALATGADPIPLMHRAWVETPSLDRLRAHDGSAPLTVDALRTTAVDILRTAARTAPPQGRPIVLSMAVVALRGLEYDLPRQVGDDIDATTHLLWRDFTITTASTGRRANRSMSASPRAPTPLASRRTGCRIPRAASPG